MSGSDPTGILSGLAGSRGGAGQPGGAMRPGERGGCGPHPGGRQPVVAPSGPPVARGSTSSQRDSSQPTASSRARIGWIVPDGSPAALRAGPTPGGTFSVTVTVG